MTSLRVLIAGAGMAGLAVHRALTARGIHADLVERDPAPRITGTGLYLPANAVRALRDLGLSGQLAVLAEPVLRQKLTDAEGRPLAGFPVGAVWGDTGACLAIRRTDLHAALLDAVGAAAVRFGVGVRAVTGDGTVTFGNGERVRYDLVIGADGIHSAVRRSLRPDVEPRFLGQVCWRFLAPSATLEAGTWAVMLGDQGRTFLAVPAGGGQAYCNAAIDSAEPAPPAGDWRSLFADFGAPAAGLLDHAGDAHFAPLHEVHAFTLPLPHVVLVGDAAHACSPSMAQGSAMAIEDALVLADTLSGRPRRDDMPWLLDSFRKRRAPRLQFVLDQNHRRDRARHLPGVVRRVVFRHFAEGIFRANHRELLARP